MFAAVVEGQGFQVRRVSCSKSIRPIHTLFQNVFKLKLDKKGEKRHQFTFFNERGEKKKENSNEFTSQPLVLKNSSVL
jgi:hypothetical protein